MTATAVRVRTIVLAAGAGSRFGGRKLEARLDGRSMLEHVLDALAGAGVREPIVVVGPDSPGLLGGRDVTAVVNPDPSRGLASSLHLGWRAATSGPDAPDAVLIALGDEPLLRPEVVAALLAQPTDPARPIIAPRYRESGTKNPVRIDRTAADLVEAATGDRGLGPLLDAHPELVRWLVVDGDNPDVDTREDLARAAELAWAARVRANREQVDRVREAPDGTDFYAAVSAIFREDPDRTGDPSLEALRRHARPGDTWLDIGAGAGRYALPLAREVAKVIALDPSAAMLAALLQAMAKHGIANVEVVEGRWPEAAADEDAAISSRLPVDVTLIAHVGYDVEAIGPFVEAMEHAATRECLALLMERSPAMLAEPFWPPVHGEQRIALPALPAFVDLLGARGREPEVEMVDASRRRWGTRDELLGYARRQTWVAPGSAKDRRLQELLDEWLVRHEDGTVELGVSEPLRVGLVRWSPA